jgi:hypothetical protein
VKIAAAYADLIIVLLDREQQSDCPGKIANTLESGFARIINKPVRVAIKNSKYENWLIGDLGALKAHPKRYNVTAALEKRVVPNKADNLDAEAELKRSIIKGQYDKVPDSDLILKSADVDSLAKNSRSFRHFLHILRCEPYRHQCRKC